jgi:hypothetical protein
MSLIFCANCRPRPPIITIASCCSRSRSPRSVLGRRRSRTCPPIFIGTDRSRICSPSRRLVTAMSIRFHQSSFLASVVQSPIHLGGSSGARYTLCSREERDGGMAMRGNRFLSPLLNRLLSRVQTQLQRLLLNAPSQVSLNPPKLLSNPQLEQQPSIDPLRHSL